MRYRAVPGTDLVVSEIGFGCGGNAGLMVRGSRAEQRAVVGRALELGITYFDTAPDYGDGAAESALGQVLRDLGAAPVITSKVEVRRENLDDVAGHVVRSAQASLRRLGVARLDVLQIHNAPSAVPPPMRNGTYHHLSLDHFLGPGGAVEGLRRLLADGSIRTAGFVSRGNDTPEVLQLLGTGRFHLVNVAYNLLHREAATGVLDQPCGAAVFSPLAGGLLAGGAPHALARPIDAAADKLALATRLHFLAEHCGSIAQAAYRFVLMHPGVTTVIGGFSSKEQLEEIAAVSGAPPLDAALLERLHQAWP